LLAVKPREPSYKGHPLSYWVVLLGKPYTPPAATDDLGFDPDQETAKEAISNIGPAALPFLSKWIYYKQPPWRTRFGLRMLRAHTPFAKRLATWAMQPDTEQRAMGSYKAIGILGNKANPAFEQLCRVLNDPHAPQNLGAPFALARFGPDSL